jgi:hypothetical protein
MCLYKLIKISAGIDKHLFSGKEVGCVGKLYPPDPKNNKSNKPVLHRIVWSTVSGSNYKKQRSPRVSGYKSV